jgi:hypothetical protein
MIHMEGVLAESSGGLPLESAKIEVMSSNGG